MIAGYDATRQRAHTRTGEDTQVTPGALSHAHQRGADGVRLPHMQHAPGDTADCLLVGMK